MTLKWYTCSDDNRVINKTLENEVNDTCVIYGTCSLDTPQLKVKSIQGNYIKFENKYYYITDKIYKEGYWILMCKIDVLKTYEQELLNTEQLIARSETLINKDLADSNMCVNTRYVVEGYDFGEDITTSATTYILGVI